MASRPRRSAATKASESISVHAKWADASDKSERTIMASRRSGRAAAPSALREPPSSPSDSHISVNVKTTSSSSKSRQVARGAARRSDRFPAGEIVTGIRSRGGRKNYVIDSSDDDDDDEAEIDDAADDDDDDDDEMDDDDLADEDADGDNMDVDAGGRLDTEGDIDMDASAAPAAPTIRVSQPSKSRSAARVAASKIAADEGDDEDDDELSDPGESDAGDQTLGIGDEIMADDDVDKDAEGEEIEVAAEEEADVAEPGNDDGSTGSPDLTKMTKRQRARFEEEPQEYMKLSDGTLAQPQSTVLMELTARPQRSKSRSTLRLRSCRCVGRKWRAGDATSARSAPKKSRQVVSLPPRAPRGPPTNEARRLTPRAPRWKPSTSC